MARPLVAIVGRPNVGKSMLFNRLVGQRLSIVEDTPGVTRAQAHAECEWCGRKFDIVDTGGIEPMTDSEILLFMREQLRRLISLTKAHGACIYGCGGGFRSEALCQMLSDLSGMELRLCSGFVQATLQGLVSMCGAYLGSPCAERAVIEKLSPPRA